MTTHTPSRAPLIAILLTLVIGAADGQVFRESTSVVVIEVPVHVIRDGKPVRGLTRDDFVVLDERKQQEIVGFEVVDLTALSAPAAASGESVAPPPSQPPPPPARMPVAARRHFLLLFDLSFSRPDSVVGARAAALELVEQGLHPSDLVAVATYSQGRGPLLLNGFTSDRPQVAAAIDSLGVARGIEPLRDPLGLVFGDLEAAGRAFGLGQGSSGRGGRGRGNFAAAMMDFARQMEAQQQRQEAQRISTLTRSLSDLATLMAGVRGRKHVIYLSEGFDTSVLFGTADVERTQRMSSASEEGRVWEIDSEERYGDTHAQNQLEKMFSAFRRADCTVQTVDVGGMQRIAGVESGSRRSTERTRANLAARHDSLATIAGATGGEFYRHFNNLSEAMGEVLERTGVTYVLTFQPKNIELDGGYHRLKVKLKDGSEGRLVHRPGYYAPRPYDELSGDEQRLSTAELIVGGRDGGAITATVFAATFAPTLAEDANAYVPAFFEIDGSSLAAAVSGSSFTGDVYAYALDADGRVRDFLGHTLSIDLEQVRPLLEQSGLKFYGHFDLAAGDYTLRMLARDRRSGLYALESFDLTVPDFAAAEPALLPPMFVEAPGKWMMAREELAAGEQRPAFPFMVGQQPFLPAARPAFKQGVNVAVNLMVYNLGESPAVESRIRTALGAELTDPAVAVAAAVPGAAGLVALRASFDTGLLDAGDYTLEVTAVDPATGRRASSSGPFVVTR